MQRVTACPRCGDASIEEGIDATGRSSWQLVRRCLCQGGRKVEPTRAAVRPAPLAPSMPDLDYPEPEPEPKLEPEQTSLNLDDDDGLDFGSWVESLPT